MATVDFPFAQIHFPILYSLMNKSEWYTIQYILLMSCVLWWVIKGIIYISPSHMKSLCLLLLACLLLLNMSWQVHQETLTASLVVKLIFWTEKETFPHPLLFHFVHLAMTWRAWDERWKNLRILYVIALRQRLEMISFVMKLIWKSTRIKISF